MAHVITDACAGVKDGACVDICPVDAIHPTRSDAAYAEADQLHINPEVCIDCGLCTDACPAHAIFAEQDLPASKREFVQINAAWFSRRGEGRASR